MKQADGMPAGRPVCRTVTIRNQRGLHARAAAKFVKAAEHFDCEITVAKQDLVGSGLSIMGLMMLSASAGCELELRAQGPDAAVALEAVARLIEEKFHEE